MKLLFLALVVSADIQAQQTITMTGHWTQQGNTNDFGYKAKLIIDTANNVDGVISWSVNKVKAATARYYSARMKSTAREYVKGTYAPGSKNLHFHGVRKNDRDKIIELDDYTMDLADHYKVTGKTKGNEGKWDGIMSGTYTISPNHRAGKPVKSKK